MDKNKKSHGDYFDFFIIRISSFFVSNNEISNSDLSSYSQRQKSWIDSFIMKKDNRFRYEIRIISTPSIALRSKNLIEFYIILRSEKIEKKEFIEYSKDFFTLTEKLFPEFELEIVDRSHYSQILKPFDINYSAQLKRSLELIDLDTISQKPAPDLGFSKIHESRNKSNDLSKVIHIPSLMKSRNVFNTFIHQLSEEKSRYIFSILLMPIETNLTLLELINKQILICERFAQLQITSSSDPTQLYPSLKEQAKYYQSFQNEFASTLKDNPLLFQLKVGSSNPLSHIILNSFSQVTSNQNRGYFIHDGRAGEHYFGSNLVIENFQTNNSAVDKSFNNVDIYSTNSELSKVNFLLEHIVNSKEASTSFYLPIIYQENLPGIVIKGSPQIANYDNFPKDGAELGLNIQGSHRNKITISKDDRRRHLYVVGQTGTGKTTLLKNMIISDIQNGNGICVIDPHGDLFNELLSSIPEERIDDVVLIDPVDNDFPVGINLLEYQNDEQRYFIAQEMVYILNKLIIDEYGTQSISEFTGPIFYQHVKMNLLLVMSNPDNFGTLLDFYNIFQIKDFWKNWLPLKVFDPLLQNWVDSILPKTDYLYQTNYGSSTGSYISSKFEQFLFDPLLRNIFAQKKSTINFNEIMDNSKILLVNLAKGRLSQTNARFFGLIILAKLQSAALERVKIEKPNRKDFFVYVDEFQSVTTENFITLLSEGRKFRINLILANQFISQIPEHIQASIFGNVGTVVSFRVGVKDAELLEKRFAPYIKNHFLINLPNWNAYVSTLINGRIVSPFSLITNFIRTEKDLNLIEKIYQNSRNKYSVPREIAEQNISHSFIKNI